MNKLLFPLGFISGLLVAFILFNRYLPVEVSSMIFGRMNVITGEVCLFSKEEYILKSYGYKSCK